MSYDVTGKVHEIFDTVQVSDTFRKREFVLEIEDNSYTQWVKFQLLQDRCSLIDQFKVGETAKVFFDLSGRPFTNKEGKKMYFTNLTAWKFEKIDASASDAASTEFYDAPEVSSGSANDDPDDLPF